MENGSLIQKKQQRDWIYLCWIKIKS